MHYELNKCRGALFCLCLALTAAGCSMSDDLDCPPGDSPATADKAYIRLSFAMPGSGSTRANPSGGELGDGQEAGQSNENTISSAVAFLYKGDGVNDDAKTPIAAVVEFDNLDGTGAGTDRPDTEHDIDKVYTTAAKELPEIEFYTYHVIVAANLSENDNTRWWTNANLTLGNVRDHILTQAWTTEADGSYSNFLMTNEADAFIELTEKNTSANPAETTVDVERVAARVDYKTNDENNYICTDQTYAGGTVKILGATIVNDYTAGSFLLKRVAADVDGASLGYLGDETPTPSGVATNYVLDPLTSQKTSANKENHKFIISQNNNTFQNSAALYASGTHSSAWSGNPNWWEGKVTAGTPMTGEGDGWTRIGYTLENTTPSGTDFAGAKEYNTGVVFQAQFTPVATAVSSKYYDYKEGRTFFEYQGKLYSTMEDLANAFFPSNNFENFKDELNAEEYATWNSVNALIESIEVNNDPSGYKDFLVKEADGKDGELTDADRERLSWTAYMRDVCGYTFDADNGGVKLDWTGGGTKPQGATSTREVLYSNGVRTYENSICYYTWWLLHSDDANENDEGVMEHAVVRNNIYKLSVESIYSLGDDVPGSTSLRVRAKVNDWVLLSSEDIIFGPTGNN